jgi:predicted Fe-Mo cluster-binding NifX family protein
MKILITAEGNDLNAPTSPRFGRCPTYVFVDTETMAFEAVSNPAVSAPGGAGIQAAQFVIEQGAQAVLTGNIGPNAADVFKAGGVQVYLNDTSTVRAAVEAFTAGQLQLSQGATVQAHAGMRMGRGRGRAVGRDLRRGQRLPANSAITREDELTALRSQATELRQQLAELIDRIEEMEKES